MAEQFLVRVGETLVSRAIGVAQVLPAKSRPEERLTLAVMLAMGVEVRVEAYMITAEDCSAPQAPSSTAFLASVAMLVN